MRQHSLRDQEEGFQTGAANIASFSIHCEDRKKLPWDLPFVGVVRNKFRFYESISNNQEAGEAGSANQARFGNEIAKFRIIHLIWNKACM